MSKCEGCQKYADCSSGSGLTWPCGAYVPTSVTRFDRIKASNSPEEMAHMLVNTIKIKCHQKYAETLKDAGILCEECITVWLQEAPWDTL